MKKILYIPMVVIALLSASCQKDEQGSSMEFTVDNYSKVSVDGELEVVFKQGNSDRLSASKSSSDTDDFLVKIKATPGQREQINIRSENGVLYIKSEDDIRLSDGVIIELYAPELEEIRLESNQIADFIGINQFDLTVVTEANSILRLLDIQVDNLAAKTEGESQLTVTTLAKEFSRAQTFDEGRGLLIDDNTLLVDNSLIFRGDSITLDNGLWTVGGENIFSHFTILNLEFKTEGKTRIDAGYAVSHTVDINLEGNSEAAVWALNSITGKGEGKSHLYYRPVGGVNLNRFTLQGEATISLLPFDVIF